MTSRIEITPGPHVLGVENLNQAITRNARFLPIHIHDYVLKVVALIGIERKEGDPIYAPQLTTVPAGSAAC